MLNKFNINGQEISLESGSSIISSIDTSTADLQFADESGKIVVSFENGHIKTKNFDSENIELPSDDSYKENRFSYPNFVGSPIPYIPNSIDTTNISVFNSVDSLYSAFDQLVSNHPDYFSKENDLGYDESGTYVMRHYCLKMQHPMICADRAGNNTNQYDYKPNPLFYHAKVYYFHNQIILYQFVSTINGIFF